MYRSIYYDSRSNLLHVWGDGQHDDLGYSVHEYQPYAYMIDANGPHTTIDGHKCKRVDQWTEESVKMQMVFEHDVSPTTRFLIDTYLDSDELPNNTKILFLDIEVAKEGKYSTPDEANNTITSITYIASGDSKYTCLLLDPNLTGHSNQNKTIEIPLADGSTKLVEATIELFKTERQLLRKFIMNYQTIGHNIITGWNVDFYDMPYLFNRIQKVLEPNMGYLLSPDAKIVKTRRTGMGNTLDIGGVAILDYLMLYRKFTYTEQSNYRLDTISKFELGRGKIEYEGDLDQLYQTDLSKFAMYNIIDVELVVELEKKMSLILTAIGICHKGHCSYSDIIYTSAYLDGAALTYCKRNGLIASSNKSNSTEQAKGAFVKQPIPGLYKWIYDLDLTSLYPMNMITLNISPETKYGKVKDWDELEYAKGTDRPYHIHLYKDLTPVGQFSDVFSQFENKAAQQLTVHGSDQLREYLSSKQLSISSNGILYDMGRMGVIPSILSSWFDDRKRFKDLRKQCEKNGDASGAADYDRKQLITKIMLNSFYGVLLLPSFRFYDKDNGEAVTYTGVSVIHWAAQAADIYYNKILGTKNKEYCIYTDTDSTFLPIEPLFNHKYGKFESFTDTEIIERSKLIINDVQKFVNDSYRIYAKKYHNVDQHFWDIKQELIAKRAFWVGKTDAKTKQFTGVKKRYAQWIVDKEGHAVDMMDVKGLDVVRSSFPSSFRALMDTILTDILHDKDKDYMNSKIREFKSNIEKCDILEIMLPTGVSDMDKWYTGQLNKRKTGTPVHVKAAMNYNDLLELNSIDSIPTIQNGDKILYAYLKQNPYGFETMALKGYQDPEQIVQFVRKYIDREQLFKSVLQNKLSNFWLSLGWGPIQLNSLGNKFFNFN